MQLTMGWVTRNAAWTEQSQMVTGPAESDGNGQMAGRSSASLTADTTSEGGRSTEQNTIH